MKAIILAAGIASRLRPLTDNTPKCLLKVGNKTLLEGTIDALISNGITDLVVVTGYLNEMIEDFIHTNYPQINVEFIHNKDYASTNNIHSLWLTKESVKGEDVLLLDSDILFDPLIIKSLIQSTHPNCLALNSHELGEEEIKIIADENHKILEISKTCSISEAIGESIGIEKMSGDFVDRLMEEIDSMICNHGLSNVFYEAAFENIIQKGAEIYAVDTTSLFSMELDTIEDFEDAQNKMPSHLRKTQNN